MSHYLVWIIINANTDTKKYCETLEEKETDLNYFCNLFNRQGNMALI